jgi:hypothetical protein
MNKDTHHKFYHVFSCWVRCTHRAVLSRLSHACQFLAETHNADAHPHKYATRPPKPFCSLCTTRKIFLSFDVNLVYLENQIFYAAIYNTIWFSDEFAVVAALNAASGNQMLASTDGDETDLNQRALAALSMTDSSTHKAHMLPPKLRAKYMFHKAKCVLNTLW